MTVTILREGAATITDVPSTIAAARLSRARMEEIINHEISSSTMRVWRKNGARIIVVSIARSLVPTGGFSDLGKNKQRMWSRWHPQLSKKVSPMSNILCFICQQPSHYMTQCLRRNKGKGPAVNTITVEVQQVMTRSKVKTTD